MSIQRSVDQSSTLETPLYVSKQYKTTKVAINCAIARKDPSKKIYDISFLQELQLEWMEKFL